MLVKHLWRSLFFVKLLVGGFQLHWNEVLHRYFLRFSTISVEQLVFCSLQNTFRTEHAMAAPYILKWDQTFGNSEKNLFFKQLIKCPLILSTLKRASTGDFPSYIWAAKAIAKGPQIYPSVCFWAGWIPWIPLHSSCIMHEHIFCLPDWGTFSNYHKSGSSHCYKKWVASVQNHHEVFGYVHFSPHDKVHLDVFKHLILIGCRHLLLASYKLSF